MMTQLFLNSFLSATFQMEQISKLFCSTTLFILILDWSM